jgi:dephospho-CoA kinase
MEIYGFAGKIGSGKNYMAEKVFLPMLTDKKTIILAFADHFKIEAIVKDNLDFGKVFGEKDELTRKSLQHRGTELGRKQYGENIWVDIVKNWIKLYQTRGYERFIIPDCRFINEVKAIKDMGGTVFKINAPQRNLDRLKKEAELNNTTLEELSSHVSEKELETDGFQEYVDYIINNDYNDNSIDIIKEIIEKDILPKTKKDLTIFVDLDDSMKFH